MRQDVAIELAGIPGTRARVAARRLGGTLAVVVAFCVTVLAFSPPALSERTQTQAAEERRPPPTVVPARDLIRMIAAGQPLDLSDVTVQGDVDLRPVGVVKQPLRCRRCWFHGSVHGRDVIFERMLDVSESTFEGRFELSGAVLKDRGSFDQAHFDGTAFFASASFEANVSFTGARFLGSSAFDRSSMKGAAFFSQCIFDGDVTFAGAEFAAKVDLSQSAYSAESDFRGTVFGGPASFSLGRFSRAARFEGAELRAGGNFRFVTFQTDVSLDRATTAGSTDFDGALMLRQASFANLTSSGSVSLEGIRLFRETELFLEGISADDFSMDVGTVDAIRGRNAQQKVLELIEKSAQERGDLDIANDARYQRLALSGDEKEALLPRLVDSVLYRTVAGYLVRPAHPLAVFLVIIVVAGLVRSVPPLARLVVERWRSRRAAPHGHRPMVQRSHDSVLTAQKVLARVLGGLAAAFAVAFRTKPGITVEDPERVVPYFVAGVLWVEFLAYKVLMAVFLLALGNSNATIRELLDAVRS